MMRINKLTDYGIVVMTRIADMDQNRVHTAREISEDTRIPLPTVTRLLKTLSGNGLLDSQRGSQGGYSLSRSSKDTASFLSATASPSVSGFQGSV